MENLELRRATIADTPFILDICADAREFQRLQGFVQWGDCYPSAEIIEGDIRASKGYLVMFEGTLVGYCVIDFDGDAEYDAKSWIWKTQGPYVAIHRLAFSSAARGKGLAKRVFSEAERMAVERGVKIVRVDTGIENRVMHGLLSSTGFTNLGLYKFVWGLRYAFEKTIEIKP